MAPISGIVITPKVEDKIGMMLKKGAELCEIAKDRPLQARVVVDDWDLQDVEVGSPARLRLNAGTTGELDGYVMSLAPASQLHQRLSHVGEEDRDEASSVAIKLVSLDGVASSASKSPAINRKRSAREQAEAAADEAMSPYEAPLTRFDALIALEGNSEYVKPGMSGEVKMYGRRRPLAVTAWRGFRDWFRSKVWW